LSTSAQSNKLSTGFKSNTPGSQQKFASHLSFGIDIIDNILNRGGAQTITTSTLLSTTTIPQSLQIKSPSMALKQLKALISIDFKGRI
jgi:hypothetical protein